VTALTTPEPVDDLLLWLRERIAARRALAEDAKGRCTGEWTFRDTAGGRHKVVDDLGYTISDTDDVDTNPWWTGPHIAANDPRAVLDLCDAHSLLLDLHPQVTAAGMLDWCGECSDQEKSVSYPCPTTRAVGVAYRRDPGYREEWAPRD